MSAKLIILATDQEGNMKSNKAKVLHQILGKPLISYIIDQMGQINVKQMCVLLGNQEEDIKNTLGDGIEYAAHEESSVLQIADFIGDRGDIIVLSGNTPLITTSSIEEALKVHRKADNGATVLSTQLNNPEVYGSICVLKAELLKAVLLQIKENNSVNYTLQGILEDLSRNGYVVGVTKISNDSDLLKVNSRSQLAQCTRIMKERINGKHMDNGVTLEDPSNTYIGPEVTIGYDTIIEPNCTLKGETTIGNNCFIGSGTNIVNSQVSSDVRIENSQIHESFIDDQAHIGPFAYIRPDSKIGKNVRIGDFVEIKNANIGDHTKVSHLTYVGDADVGRHVNFGCGSVLVNYDSVNKHRSIIEDYAFVGCNTNLVSPVHIGKRAFTAAGSTITNDVPKESLGISRVRQVNKEGWVAYKYPKK